MSLTEPGFYQMTAAEYHSDPAPQPSLSHSTAMDILDRSAFYAWYYHSRLGGNQKTASREMDNGTVAHLMLTGRGRQVGIIDEDSYRKASSRIERDAIRLKGHTPVLAKDYKVAEDMVRTVRQALGLMATGQYAFDPKYGHCELVALNRDAVGVWMRTMIDFYGAKMPTGVECWDYKTTSGSANPVMLRGHMSRMGWAVQAAAQERIITQLKPELAGRVKFRFLVQETEPPFLCSVVAPAASAMIIAHKMIAAALSIWHGCIERDTWPSYVNTPIELAVQPWVEASWLMREIEFDELGVTRADPWLNTFEGWASPPAPPPVLSEMPIKPAEEKQQPGMMQLATCEKQSTPDERATEIDRQPKETERADGPNKTQRAKAIEAPREAKRPPGRPRKMETRPMPPRKPPPEAVLSDELPPEPPRPQRLDI